ncbi:hypothetical protein H0H87_002690 [Tephrocybe sp. NHM501043]|nr:hypothetical protein H0H87_002690 [Tephrocybe sp. NHM501043]
MPSEKALARASRPSRAISPDDADAWDSDSTLYEPGLPIELDEPYPYTFKKDQEVWIKTKNGHWCPGRVLGTPPKSGKTRQKDGYYWRVIFGDNGNLRKDFAPLNGEIKPNDANTLRLLKAEGWVA